VPCPGEADVSFLIDTGADRTVIMPPVWIRFSVPLNRLEKSVQLNGIGGLADAYVEKAILTFSEVGFGLRSYELDITIYKPSANTPPCASLLGRDILKNWALTFDPTNNNISAKVLRADHSFKFTKTVTAMAPLVGVSPAIQHL
jgi:hypothetical protein